MTKENENQPKGTERAEPPPRPHSALQSMSLAARSFFQWARHKPMPDDNYRAAFERLWDDKSEQPVSNGKPEHASALLAIFLSRAKTRVAIFCKELKAEVYDDPAVITALERSIEDGIEIEVLVQGASPKNSIFASKLREAHVCGNNKIVFQENLTGIASDYKFNFAFVDDHAYRFEKDRDEMQAVASAWNEHTVKMLATLFSLLKVSAGHDTAVPAGSS